MILVETQKGTILEDYKGVKQVILVHGEATQADVFKEDLNAAHPDWLVQRPNEGDTIELH